MLCHRLSFFLLFFLRVSFLCAWALDPGSSTERRGGLESFGGVTRSKVPTVFVMASALTWRSLWFVLLAWSTRKTFIRSKNFTVFTFERVGWQMSTGVWASVDVVWSVYHGCLEELARFLGFSGGTTEEHEFISLTAGSSHKVKLGSVSLLQLLTVAQAQRMEKPFDSHQQWQFGRNLQILLHP